MVNDFELIEWSRRFDIASVASRKHVRKRVVNQIVLNRGDTRITEMHFADRRFAYFAARAGADEKIVVEEGVRGHEQPQEDQEASRRHDLCVCD